MPHPVRSPQSAPTTPSFARTVLAVALQASLMGGVGLHSVASAQTAASQPASAQRFDLPAAPLDRALNAFAAQAGILLAADGSLTAGKTGAPLHGSYTVRDALGVLLAGSGLEAVAQGSGYTLRRAVAPAKETPGSAAAATQGNTLGVVTVTAPVEREARTEGSGLYTTGESSTATRMGLSVRETPQSVTVITRQMMDDQSLTSLPEVLEKTSGVTVGRNDSERMTFYSRGYSIENFQFDGVPNTMDSASQYTTSLADTAIYDRVEVVKGATGLLTGAGNPSAVINLVRKRPTKEFMGSAEVGVGSHSRVRGVGDLSTPLNADGSVRARVVAVAQNAKSQVDYYSRDVRSLYGILEADLAPRTTVSLGVDHMQTHATGASFGHIPLFYSDGRQTHLPTSFNPATRWSYWDNDSTNLFAELKHGFDNGWKLNLSASRLRQSRDVEVGVAAYGDLNPVTGKGINVLEVKIPTQATTQAVNAALSGTIELFGREHELSFGASWSRQRRLAPGYSSGFEPVDNYFEWNGNYPKPDFQLLNHRVTRISEKGAFGAARLRPMDDLSVIVGARVSWYNLLDDTTGLDGSYSVADRLRVSHKVIPYAGVVYDLNRQFSLYASYTDIFNPQTYYKNITGSPLPPLTGKSQEVGVKGEFLDGRLNASLALFHTRQRNAAQFLSANPQTGEEAYVAVDGVTSRGVEMEVAGSIRPGWNVYGGYTYRISHAPAQPDVILSAVNTNQPRHLFKLSTSYRLPGAGQRWTVGGSLSWQSDTYYQQSTEPYWRADQPAYALVGLMARYEVDRKWSVTLNVNNLFDKTYMPGLGSYGTGVYGDGRDISLTARYQF